MAGGRAYDGILRLGPRGNLLEVIAWVTYLLAVGYAVLRPHPLPEGAARAAVRNNQNL